MKHLWEEPDLDLYDKEILGAINPEKVEEMLRHQYRIMVKTTYCGPCIYTDIYPVWVKVRGETRAKKKKRTREEQQNLNDKNTRRYIIQLINNNFIDGDLRLDLTYKDYYYPTLTQALKDIRNYINRLKYYRKKEGLSDLKYLYVIEFVPEGESTKKVRIHHHIIINAMDRDVAEDLWNRGRKKSVRLETDEYGLEGVARYITKNKTSHRRWAASRNLKKPKVTKSVTKLNKKGLAELAKSYPDIEDTMIRMYRGKYLFNDAKVYYSDYTAGFYIYGRLRKPGTWKPPEPKPVRRRKKRKMKKCDIYIDMLWSGSFGNGTGTYSIVLEMLDETGTPHTREHYGRAIDTTQNRACLHAVLKALEKFKEPCDITIHLNNRYITASIENERIREWQQEGWTAKNADLWKEVYPHLQKHLVTIEYQETNTYTAAQRIQLGLKQQEKISEWRDKHARLP